MNLIQKIVLILVMILRVSTWDAGNSGELSQLMVNYKQRLDTVQSTTNLNVDWNNSSILSDTVGRNFNKTDVSSLFDSTDEVHCKNSESNLDINPKLQGIFFHIFETLESYEEKIQKYSDLVISLKDELNNVQQKCNTLNTHKNFFDNQLDFIYDQIYKMDCKIVENNQYARRESIIISGIPDKISQNQLEEVVIDILRTVGLTTISSYNISACHRLKKNKNDRFSAQTIVRFTNRKIVNFCLTNRDRLLEVKNILNMNLRFYESLCDSNKTVYKECHDLKKYGLIDDFYLRNGFVKIIKQGDRNPIKIKHPEDLDYYFPEYYMYEGLY